MERRRNNDGENSGKKKSTPAVIPRKPLSDEQLFPRGLTAAPNWTVLRDHLHAEGRITKDHLLTIIGMAERIFTEEPNLLKLKDPITVVGDIHGQYYDFLKILEVGGQPGSNTQYLFLGDYVDRGCFSVACVLLLLTLKINFPERIWMLRGNHECRQMTGFFNFKDECIHRYDSTVYTRFMELFDALPLGAVINSKFLGVHGGLSPELRLASNINAIERFSEPPKYGLFCDLIWADPIDEEKYPNHHRNEPYAPNDVRGCSYFFSHEAASTFLERNKLLSVVRAHEAQIEGYKMHNHNARTGFPSVITIFSAPNYCDCYNNKGAILLFENNTLNIQQFNYVQHPYCLPNFMDIFTWSIPFVADKVVDMLGSVLNDLPDPEPGLVLPPEISALLKAPKSRGVDQKSKQKMKQDDADRLRVKVLALGRLVRALTSIRQNQESINTIKKMNADHKLPTGTLLRGQITIDKEYQKLVGTSVKAHSKTKVSTRSAHR